jgi:hypothetical protein
MSSANRYNANIRNARRSTGPRTSAGKAISRLNSLTHAAFAADLLLPGEDRASFRRLEARFHKHYLPVTPAELFLINRMVLASWRLLRLAAMESRVLRAEVEGIAADKAIERNNLIFASGYDELLNRPDPPAPRDQIARAWIYDAEGPRTLFKFVRFQNSLERSFYRAHKLLLSMRAADDSQGRP